VFRALTRSQGSSPRILEEHSLPERQNRKSDRYAATSRKNSLPQTLPRGTLPHGGLPAPPTPLAGLRRQTPAGRPSTRLGVAVPPGSVIIHRMRGSGNYPQGELHGGGPPRLAWIPAQEARKKYGPALASASNQVAHVAAGTRNPLHSRAPLGTASCCYYSEFSTEPVCTRSTLPCATGVIIEAYVTGLNHGGNMSTAKKVAPDTSASVDSETQ
jgi:hypothetical protein